MRRPERITGGVLWFTGLSGAGKSTLARAAAAALSARGMDTEVLDGDDVREHLSKGLGFSKEDRETNVRRIAFVANLLARHGVLVLVAAISPFRQGRSEARRIIERFVEIYVSAPLDVCAARDVKGLYARARAGHIQNFTGISQAYEPPESPELVLDTSRVSLEQCIASITSKLQELGYSDGA